MVFDVESIGLHGEGFAVGFTVVTRLGDQVQWGLIACPPEAAIGSANNLEWVKKNVPPLMKTHDFPVDVREQFWQQWLCWKERGALLVADCAWPVEARFLRDCVTDDLAAREWQGPYPLHDLASVILANGGDPLEKFERLSIELPEHNPLNDARQSARILTRFLSVSRVNLAGCRP